MIGFIEEYYGILAYLFIWGGVASVLNNLLHKRFLGLSIKSFSYYGASFVLGGGISIGVYLLCEIFFFLPLYLQTPLGVLCAYFSFDIVFAFKNARSLYKTISPLPVTSIDVAILQDNGYTLLFDTRIGDTIIPKGFQFRGFKKYFLLRYLCPSDCITISAYMVYEYTHDKKTLLAVLLSKKSILGLIIAFVCYIHISIVDKTNGSEQD